MKKDELQKYIDQYFSISQISDSTGKSKTTVRYWLRKHELNTNPYKDVRKDCVECSEELRGKQRKFCSSECKKRHSARSHKYYRKQKTRGIERKQKLIDAKGGACQKCGYNKCLGALHFHHRNPENKCFSLDMRKCSNTNWKSLTIEAAKCDLLCANCHAELHELERSCD